MNEFLSKNEYKYWSKASVIEIIDYLEQVHQTIKNEKIPNLQQLLEKTIDTYKGKHSQMLKSLQEFFIMFKTDAEDHIKREEEILFSYIRKLEIYKRNGGAKPVIPFSSIENPISQIELDHVKLENALLETMGKIASAYQSLEEPSDTFKAFYKYMKALESEIMKHMHLETDILFPEAIELELSILHGK